MQRLWPFSLLRYRLISSSFVSQYSDCQICRRCDWFDENSISFKKAETTLSHTSRKTLARDERNRSPSERFMASEWTLSERFPKCEKVISSATKRNLRDHHSMLRVNCFESSVPLTTAASQRKLPTIERRPLKIILNDSNKPCDDCETQKNLWQTTLSNS